MKKWNENDTKCNIGRFRVRVGLEFLFKKERFINSGFKMCDFENKIFKNVVKFEVKLQFSI